MQKLDHDERRRSIAEATLVVIAREGLEAATIRRIAEELDGPTKLITYYFAEKHELLLWAYRSLSDDYECAAQAVVMRDPADLLGALLAMAPVDARSLKLWKVYVAFWDLASRDPGIAGLQQRQIERALQRLATIVRARSGDRADLESVCERLNAIVQGLAIQALMNPTLWNADRLRTRLREEIEISLGPPAVASL